MLHRTSEEIDKQGNVIGGELKEKCDSFISCLEEFENEYLSDKYNTSTESGRDQQRVINNFKRWLENAIREYSPDKKKHDDYLEDLRRYRGQIALCHEQAKNKKLEQLKIDGIMNILSADLTERRAKIMEKNAEIEALNAKRREMYDIQWSLYMSRKVLYDLHPGSGIAPTPPDPPAMLKTLPLPKGPSLPSAMTDKMFRNICEVVDSGIKLRVPRLLEQSKSDCKKYVEPLLKMALRYCDELIRENDLNDPERIIKWYEENAMRESDKSIYRYLNLLCPYGTMGFPVFDDKKTVADIYWTCIFIDCSKVFKSAMSNFKSDQGGSSSTKKWIDKVVKSLSKEVKGKDYKELLEKKLENLAESLKIKAPTSISKRPTIKQKPVKEKLETLSKRILDAKKKIPNFEKRI